MGWELVPMRIYMHLMGIGIYEGITLTQWDIRPMYLSYCCPIQSKHIYKNCYCAWAKALCIAFRASREGIPPPCQQHHNVPVHSKRSVLYDAGKAHKGAIFRDEMPECQLGDSGSRAAAIGSFSILLVRRDTFKVRTDALFLTKSAMERCTSPHTPYDRYSEVKPS